MKRYVLFAGDVYYPGGGFEDFEASSDSLADLKRKAKAFTDKEREPIYVWWHIVDRQTDEIVAKPTPKAKGN